MSDENVEVDVPVGRHIRNVRTGPSAAFWFRLAGAGVVIVAAVFFVLSVSGIPLLHIISVSRLFFFTMLFGPSLGLILMLSPWVARANAHPTKSAFPRVLAVAALAVLSIFVSLALILANLEWS